jgi:NAD(P)-dependent dehydrogenase (short-subunit alcohol dehydrogenase family)
MPDERTLPNGSTLPSGSVLPNLPELFNLTGRVAVVTGGAGLLGAEFCQTLAAAGAYVVIADLDGAAARALADAINSVVINRVNRRSTALAIGTDVTSAESVQRMVETTLDAFGRLDILVNSAALDPKFDPQSLESVEADLRSGRFEDYPLEAWNEAIAVNLTGAFLCCQAAARAMLSQGGGVMINLSSIYGLAGPDQRMYQRLGKPIKLKPVFYSVTKWGILGLTQYLATYYAGKNIRVNAISPGGVYNGHDEAFIQAYSARAVLGRMARKDEMNGALLFLASDASSYMTGANLIVDGGWTAW